MIRKPNHIGTLALTQDWGTRVDRLQDFEVLVTALNERSIPYILPASFRPFKVDNGFDDNFDDAYTGSTQWQFQITASIHACGKMIVFMHEGWRQSPYLEYEINLCQSYLYPIYYAGIFNGMVSIYTDPNDPTSVIA